MKRKVVRVFGIILGVLILILLILGLGGPIFARLGMEPICIQGNLPNLKLVSCNQPKAPSSTVTPLPMPDQDGQGTIPVIMDDDGSPDGVIALLYFLSNPNFDVRGVTVSQGEAHPELFAEHILRLLAGLGREDVPVGAGNRTPLKGNNAFPDPWRQASDSFWDINLPTASTQQEVTTAAELIVDTINNSQKPVLVFVSGPHTNLALALRLDPGIAGNIHAVYIMGGSVYVPGNIHSDWPQIDNQVAEWNIWADPVAASEVFSSGLPLHLIPLDAT